MFGKDERYVTRSDYDWDLGVIRANIRCLGDRVSRCEDSISMFGKHLAALAEALGYELVREPAQIVARKIKKA